MQDFLSRGPSPESAVREDGRSGPHVRICTDVWRASERVFVDTNVIAHARDGREDGLVVDAQLTTVKSVCGGCAAGRVKRVRLGAVLE